MFLFSCLGSLYINQYFSEKDKQAAEVLVDFILEEYIATIDASEWMNEDIKSLAIDIANKTQRFIGYHEKLRSSEAENYYNELEQWPSENFIEMGLSLIIYTSDKEFQRLHLKRSEKVADWTK